MFGAWGGWLLRSGSARKDGVGRRGGVVWEEEGEVFLSSRRFPREPAEHRASDNTQTGSAAPLFLLASLSGISRVSACCYLFNDSSSTDLVMVGKLVSLLTAAWHRGKQEPNASIYWYHCLINRLMHNKPILKVSHVGVMEGGGGRKTNIQYSVRFSTTEILWVFKMCLCLCWFRINSFTSVGLMMNYTVAPQLDPW